MSSFIAKLANATGFFSFPSKAPAPKSGSRMPPSASRKSQGQQDALSSKRVKSSGSGNIKSGKGTKVPSWDKVKESKITKRTDASGSIARTKGGKQKWGFSGLLKFNEWPPSREVVENTCSEGETLMEDKIKREEEDEDEATITADESFDEHFKRKEDTCIPLHENVFQPDDVRIKDWSEDEIWVFNKLIMRGREPLLPCDLAFEFPSWPNILFSRDPDKVVINNLTRSNTNLATAFNRFLYEGVSVRSRLHDTAHLEHPIERALRGFHKFIMQDGKLRLKENPPLICIAAATENEGVSDVVERCTKKMYKAGRQWREWLNTSGKPPKDPNAVLRETSTAKLPTIYGFVVKYSVLAIMTWDPSLGEEESVAKPVRTIGTYDWQIAGQDVWHALAVGIVECKARSYLIELDGAGVLGEDRVESDPDL